MIGIELSTYKLPLVKVAEEHNEQPWNSFDVAESIGAKGRAYFRHYIDDKGEMKRQDISKLPLKALRGLSFDQLSKMKYSSIFMMERSVIDLFEKDDPQYMIVHKIISSMWRWGMSRDTWNNVVDAYDGIRSFDLGLPDFEVRLDHTTSYNEQGYSEYSRTFLDGVFAFLVHYRGEHVMTVGFSVLSERRILIQQVQLAKRKGNRFLFKMPQNRVEYFIDCFRAAFPNHALYMIDGADVANKSLKSYISAKVNADERLTKLHSKSRLEDYETREIERLTNDANTFAERIDHLIGEVERLRAFYADTGKYKQGEHLRVHNLIHYALAA